MYGEAQRLLTGSLPVLTKTELTFDFHRLNILLLRSVTLDSGMTVARKIATATMTDAKIHATVGKSPLALITIVCPKPMLMRNV